MVVRRIGVWSAARLYAGISGALGLVIGAIFAMISMVGAGIASQTDTPFPAAFLGIGAVVVLPICYGVIGLIGGAIGAALYNLFAGIFGGIELEVQQ